MVGSEKQQEHRMARLGAIGAITAAALTGAATLGAAAITDQSPTSVVINFWQTVTGGGDSAPRVVYPSPTPSGSITPSTLTQTVPQPGAIYHSDPLRVTYDESHNWMDGVRVDLDAPATDPQWGVVTLADGAQYDLTWWSHNRGSVAGEGLDFLNGAQGVVLDSADDSTCQAATGYTGHASYKDLKVGRTLCVITSEKRYAVLHIADHSADGRTLGFDPVKTFRKATDQ